MNKSNKNYIYHGREEKGRDGPGKGLVRPNALPFIASSRLLRRRQWHSTLVLLPGKSHGRRSLVGCSPWGCEESDTTEWLHFHFSLSCIGEGNGNPLQCSCLENPRDGGAWWAAVYGVAQSWKQLQWLSSSSSSSSSSKSSLLGDHQKVEIEVMLPLPALISVGDSLLKNLHLFSP